MVASLYDGVELGVGESILQKAISEACGISLARVRKEYNKLGDLGLVAAAFSSKVQTLVAPSKLTVSGVHHSFLQIAQESGGNSMQRRLGRIRSLLVNSREEEAAFIVKALQGKMRINMGPKTVLAAVAKAFARFEASPKIPSKEVITAGADLLEKAYNQRPDWVTIVSIIFESKLESLPEKIFIESGIPFAPMLAQPTKGIEEIFERLADKKFTAEWKYDGERAQIHCDSDGTVAVFSRNLANTTGKFPDIVEGIVKAKSENTISFILDTEAVAYDAVKKQILPFQILSTRSRKEVKIEDVKVRVCIYAFDLVYLNGESLIHHTFRERRELMCKHFTPVEGFFQFATYKDLDEPDQIQSWLMESIKGNCEGLMVKTLDIDAQYQAAKRAYQWLKVKKDYLEGMGDTLDLVPIGAFQGHGKRTGVYGGYLLACYDDESETYQSICKIGTGFSDVQLSEFTAAFKETVIPKAPNYFHTGDAKKDMPDYWLEPTVVWEIQAADLSISPVHKAAVGLVHERKGIALRFPRLMRVRDDK
eukprot:TRINITY_DN981_c0_g1_i1.p1 TRINITY_DN981_c0_g1~~TRINITY_DN981_c0_g1_i1.p1  ORF type:complete len:535 (-),score=125.48 TRINITY_DN981_c0_g1_i1:5-1609(-)